MVWGKFSRKHYSTDEKLINEKSSIKVYTIGIKPQNSRSFTATESLEFYFKRGIRILIQINLISSVKSYESESQRSYPHHAQ